MKTVKQWLETIEDPEIKKRAFENANNPKCCVSTLDKKTGQIENFKMALLAAFQFSWSPEGMDFWFYILCKTPTPAAAKFKDYKHLIQTK